MEQREGAHADFSDASLEQIKSVLAARHYEMKECLGTGGFSMVFRVHSHQFHSDFAAKITNTASKRHRDAHSYVDHEGDALSNISHPNIVKIYERFEDGDFCFLILEYCEHGPLKNILGQGGLPENMAIRMMRQIAEGVMHMHMLGYVHRDIKPSNVLLDEHWRPKLADFGMCLKFPRGEYLNDFSGSPQYMPPEMVRKVPFDPYKADIWALGVTFYEIANGLVKWPGTRQLVETTIMSVGLTISPRTPRPIAKVVKAMTAMDPRDRPKIERVVGVKLFREEKQALSSRSLATGTDQLFRGWGDVMSPTTGENPLNEALRVKSTTVIQSGQRALIHTLVTGKPQVLSEVKPLMAIPNTNRLVVNGACTARRRPFPLIMAPVVKRTQIPRV